MLDYPIKQLYEGADKEPFYPKVPMEAIGGIDPNTNLEDNVKTISKTVYGTETPGKTSSTSSIDTVPEVYEFLSGYNKGTKLIELINTSGGGNNVSVTSYYSNYPNGTKVADIKVDSDTKSIVVPHSIVSDYITRADKWHLTYDPDTTVLTLTFENNELAHVQLNNTSEDPEPVSYYTRPNKPVNVSANYSTSTGATTVSWAPVLENGVNIPVAYVTAYEIDRYKNGSFVETVRKTDVDPQSSSVVSWVDSDIEAGSSYYYIIRARSSYYTDQASPNSDPSVTVNIPDDSDVNASVSISFGNAELGDGVYSGTTMTNILRNIDYTAPESYTAQITVTGARQFLTDCNYVQVLGFTDNFLDQTVELGSITESNGKYVRTASVSFTVPSNASAGQSLSAGAINLYVRPNENTGQKLHITKYYNFIYPLYAGYIDDTIWENSGNTLQITDTILGAINNKELKVKAEEGYDIIGTVVNCKLTSTQSNGSSSNRYHAQICIPSGVTWNGSSKQGMINEYRLPTSFTDKSGTFPVVMDDTKTVSFYGITYYIYTAAASIMKTDALEGTEIKLNR